MTAGDFWTRRREAVAAEAEAEQAAVAAREAEAVRSENEDKSDAEILAQLGLKDPDTLKAGDDFSAFLQSAVPERLRRRALRRLWLSNPLLANLDELVDYGEDYTDAATVVETLQTTYQVGKGMMKHILHTAPAAPEEAEPIAGEQVDLEEPAAVADATAPEAPQPVALHDPGRDAAASATPGPDGADTGHDDAEPYAPPSRRRMKFAFS